MRLRIRELRLERGWSLEHLSELAGLSRSHLNQIELGLKRPNTARLEQIAVALGVAPRELIADEPSATPILGKVAAGTEQIAIDGQGEQIGEIATPTQLRGVKHLAAVLVEGESMQPAIPPGSSLFFRRQTAEGVPTEALGRICVVEDAAGLVWVKHVRQGSETSLFNLISLNPLADIRPDVPLRWAAPVLLWLPPELTQQSGTA